MSSEIRANTLKNRVGLSTINITNTGIVVSGVSTFAGNIIANDKIGIGTDNLTYPLEIHDSDPRIQLIDTDLASSRSVQLRNNQGSFVQSASQHTILYTNGSERVRIKSNGRIGIGTIDPKTLLNVYTHPHSDTGGILVQNANYTANLDKPY